MESEHLDSAISGRQSETGSVVVARHRPWYRKPFLITLLALIIGGIGLVLLLDNVVMPLYVKSGAKATVPNVVGLDHKVAVKRLSDAGYTPVEYEVRFDNKVKQGLIIRQTPESGQETKPGRRVLLIISGGKEMAQVPPLVGKSLRDAKMILLKSNLSVGTTDFAYSDSAAYGAVFRQVPGPGAKVSANTAVNLVVSQGPMVGRVPVPNLRNLTLAEAIARLNSSNLALGKVSFESREEGTPNTIVDQYPTPGELLIEGSSVDVFVIRDE